MSRKKRSRKDLDECQYPTISFIEERNGEYCLNEDAVRFLQTIDQPFGVLTVCGSYRTGKSVLLNRCFLRKTSFETSSSIQSCTKGLVISTKLVDAENCKVLVIDTEGLNAIDKTVSYDSNIFTLAILLSTYFVYNSKGNIDEQAVQQLNLISNICQMVEKNSKAELSFPDFHWVVRDFDLQLNDREGNSVSADDYLEQALSDGSRESSRSKQNLKKLFHHRRCTVLPRPTDDCTNISSLPDSDLNFEFVRGLESIRRSGLRFIKPICQFGRPQPLTGKLFVELARLYVDILNSQKLPEIKDTWMLLSENQNRKIADVLLSKFIENCETIELPSNPSILFELLRNMQKDSINKFDSQRLGEADEIKESLMANLNREMSKVVKENREQCSQMIRKSISKLDNSSLPKMRTSANRIIAKLIEAGLVQDASLEVLNSILDACEQISLENVKQVKILRENNRKISNEVEQLHSQVVCLEGEKVSLKRVHADALRDSENKRATIEESLRNHESECNDWKRKVRILTEECEELKNAGLQSSPSFTQEKTSEEIEKLRNDLQMCMDEKLDNEKSEIELRKTIEAMEKKISLGVKVENELDNLRQEYNQTKQELDDMESEKEAIEQAWQSKLISMQNESMESLNSMKKLVTSHKEKTETLQSLVDNTKQTLKREQEMKKTMEEQHQQSLHNMKKTIKIWEDTNGAQKKEIERYHMLLTSQQEQADKERQRLVEGHREEMRQIEVFQAERRESLKNQLQSVRAKSSKSDIEIEKQKVEIRLLNQRVDRQKKEIKFLSSSQSSANQSSIEVNELQTKLKFKESDLQNAREELSKVRKTLKDSDKKVKQLERTREFEITRLTLNYEKQISILENKLSAI